MKQFSASSSPESQPGGSTGHNHPEQLLSSPPGQVAHPHPQGEHDDHDHAHPHPHDEHDEHDGHGHPHTQATTATAPNGRTRPAHIHPHDEQGHDHPHDDHGEHDHPHGEHDHPHGDGHSHGRWGWLTEWLPFSHGHSHGEANYDQAMETNERGLWALKISLLGLGATAIFQVIIVLISGSVALLADTIHNFSDALTAIPLWIAFVLARRSANRRYTYGYGRAEDLAGVAIVAIIFISALVAAYESYLKIVDPQPISNLGWVMAAAIVGFIGNEAVAIFRIKVGREIGSAALVADGQHARVDGVTSLAVLVGAIGVWLGFPLADPIVGLLITVAILFIVKDSAITMWRRMMDAVEPELVDSIEQAAGRVPGVLDVAEVRVRWLGHKLQAELQIGVDGNLPTYQSHHLAEEVRHALYHTQPRLSAISVHVDPVSPTGDNAHTLTDHHARTRLSSPK